MDSVTILGIVILAQLGVNLVLIRYLLIKQSVIRTSQKKEEPRPAFIYGGMDQPPKPPQRSRI